MALTSLYIIYSTQQDENFYFVFTYQKLVTDTNTNDHSNTYYNNNTYQSYNIKGIHCYNNGIYQCYNIKRTRCYARVTSAKVVVRQVITFHSPVVIKNTDI